MDQGTRTKCQKEKQIQVEYCKSQCCVDTENFFFFLLKNSEVLPTLPRMLRTQKTCFTK